MHVIALCFEPIPFSQQATRGPMSHSKLVNILGKTVSIIYRCKVRREPYHIRFWHDLIDHMHLLLGSLVNG